MVYDMGYPDDEWTESEGGPDEAGGSGRGERAFMNAVSTTPSLDVLSQMPVTRVGDLKLMM
jgi:hypothetical protein